MKETFGVELELITSKFSQKMNEMIQKTKSIGQKMKQNFDTGRYMDLSSARKELASLESQLDSMKGYHYDWFELPNGQMVETKAHINSLITRINDLKADINTVETSKIAKIGQVFQKIKAPIDKIKASIKSNNVEMSKFSGAIGTAFNKGISSIKRFGLSLFGIRAIWTAVSRASSSYLSNDIELSNKLSAVWTGLGAMLSPILERLANFFLKLIGYLNVFIKSLTGVDLLANAMKKADDNTKKTTKSVKKLQGMLGGFDEINNIAPQESGDTPDVSWVDAIKGIQLDTSWTTAIESWGEWIKNNWQLIVVGITGIITVLTALKLASVLTSIGLTGMTVPLLAIALGITGLISLVMGIIELFKEGGDESKAWTLILGGLALAVIAVGIAFGGIPALIALVVAAVVAGILWIVKHWEEVKTAVMNFPNWLREKFGLIGDILAQPFENGIKLIKGLWNGAKQFFGGVKEFFEGIFTLDGTKIVNGLKSMLVGMGNIIISFIEGVINAFLIPINTAIKLINKIPGVEIPTLKVTIPRLPSFDVGTNYVPKDMEAVVHKGEAIVPKRFNSSEFFGRGNEEVVEKLEQLIVTLENKDMNAYIDSDAIGRTAKNWINSQKRITGRSVV